MIHTCMVTLGLDIRLLGVKNDKKVIEVEEFQKKSIEYRKQKTNRAPGVLIKEVLNVSRKLQIGKISWLGKD